MEVSRLTKEEAQEALTLLSREFKVPVPKLYWSARSRRGHYWMRRQTVSIGPRCWRGAEASLIHEFAHHLTNVACGEHHHDSRFWSWLKKAAAAWYGDWTKYDWAHEYSRGKVYAERWQAHERAASLLP